MDRTEVKVSRKDIIDATRVVYRHCIRTPLFFDYYLSGKLRADVYLKMEMFQPVRAFKIRGASNKMSHVAGDSVVTASSGNHGLAVAYVAKAMGKKAAIVLPENVNESKLRLIKSLGAETVISGLTTDDRMATAKRLSETRGMTMIPPFDDPLVIAGQGTAGLEIQTQTRCDYVISPVGGGGLISGIALAYDNVGGTEVIGAQSEKSRSMYESLSAGKPVTSKSETVADGIAVSTPGTLNVGILAGRVRRILLVSDAEIMSAVKEMWQNSRVLMEPASASTVAALLKYRREILGEGGQSVALIISGGNVSDSLLKSLTE